MEPSASRIEYTSRINTVIHYISEHLNENLSLEQLARIAFFSQYHFHRLFSSIMNETPADFVLRLRLEKAANILAQDRPQSITEIAYNSGFSSPSVFSRAFVKHFGVSASKWRKKCKTKSKKREELLFSTVYFSNKKQKEVQKRKMNIEVKTMPAWHVAYVANMHGYKMENISHAWELLFRWAGAHELLNDKTVVLGMSFDNPDITPEDKCRYYACIVVPPETTVSREIAFMDIAGGKYAVFRFEGKSKDINGTYKKLYSEWLPTSGYLPEDQPCYELYHKSPDQSPRGLIVMDICLPVKPL
jgi:AraC family transcriptional regulator